MGYEINVSKNGVHYFATADRSIGYDLKKCTEIYSRLMMVFPKNAGYKITRTNWERVGQPYDIEEEMLTNESEGERKSEEQPVSIYHLAEKAINDVKKEYYRSIGDGPTNYQT